MPPDNAAPTTPKQAVWRIEMLGGLRALSLQNDGERCHAEPVTQFRTHKAALLLARLVLFPHRAHARDELADWLWPDAPADRGRASLSQTLVYLRHALGQPRKGGVFIADHQTVRVAQNAFQTDVAEWEEDACRALEIGSMGGPEAHALVKNALAAYTGDLLPGFYDGWLDGERSRLAELRDALQARLPIVHETSSAVAAPHPKPTVKRSEETLSDEPLLHNAPLFLTRFFGRETEGETVCGLLQQSPPVRLVSLLGMGGIGKTRLAVEVAQTIVGDDNAPFGWAAFVPLAEAQNAGHMESLLLGAFGLQNENQGLDAAIEYLNAVRFTAHRRVLLVLDNLEQLGSEAAPVVNRLLALVPRLTILATSRQPVGIAGEQEVPLGPLGDSASAAPQAPEGAATVRLFVDRARLVRPSFSLTPENRIPVFTLCQLLEGVPLALELAAAWARVLTPPQMVARLNNRFDLLQLRGTFSGEVPKRHQSLHAAITWSYDLLGPSLQTFFAQLSVFRGGWTVEAAQAVTGVKNASEPLLLLAERSLILAEPDEATGALRYRMLELLREFAHEQAEATGRDFCAALCLCHAQYFDTLSQEADHLVQSGKGLRPALSLLGAERDNLRAAFARFLVPIAEPVAEAAQTASIRLVVQSIWLWTIHELRGYLHQAAELARLLPDETGHPLRASVLLAQGVNTLHTGDYEQAERQLSEGLAIWEGLKNQKEVIAAKSRLAWLAAQTGDLAGAVAGWTECLHFAQNTDNVRLESAFLNNLAIIEPEVTQRRAWIERAVFLDRNHAPCSHFLACSLNSMGGIAAEQKDFQTARTCLEEAHTIAVADGFAGMIGVAKASLAGLFYETGEQLDRAEYLLQEAQTLFEQQGESLRVAGMTLLRFRVALKSGNADAALSHAHDYLRVNREVALMDAEGIARAQVDMAGELRKVGFAAQAEQVGKYGS